MSDEQQPQPGDEGATGWSWGPLGSAVPGYGPPPTTPEPAPPSGRPPYGQPQYGQPQYGQPQYGAPQHGQPQYGAPQAPQGQPPYPQPQYGQPPYAQPQYGPPQYGPQYGQPQYGQPQYGQPQYGQPQYGRPQYGVPQYGAPVGYAPAPVQPGIVPLRPLSLGEIYDGAFRSIRANPGVMFGFSLLVVGVAAVVGGLAWWLVIPTVSGWVDTNLPAELGTQGGDDFIASVYSMYAMIPFLALAGVVLNGVLTVSVSRSVIGQKIAVAELWRQYWKRVLLVGVYTLLTAVGTIVLSVVFTLLVVALAAATGSGGGAAVLAVLGALGLLVLFAWIAVRLLFVPPVIMLERLPLFRSIARSWTLTRGSFWRILGIYLLAQLISQVVSQVLSVPTSIIGIIVAGPDLGASLSGAYVATMTIGMAIAYTIPTIFLAAVVALQYVDVRIRKEGLDVQLARAAENVGARTGLT